MKSFHIFKSCIPVQCFFEMVLFGLCGISFCYGKEMDINKQNSKISSFQPDPMPSPLQPISSCCFSLGECLVSGGAVENLHPVQGVCSLPLSVSLRTWGFCFAEQWTTGTAFQRVVAQAVCEGVTQWTCQQGHTAGYLLPVNNSAEDAFWSF